MRATQVLMALSFLSPFQSWGALAPAQQVRLTMPPEAWAGMQQPKKIEVTDGVEITIDGETHKVKAIANRGQTSIKAPRHNLKIDLEKKTQIFPQGSETTDYILTSMWQDDHYISNRIGFGLMRETGIFEIPNKYVELIVNDETRGLYLLTESSKSMLKSRKAIWAGKIYGSPKPGKDGITGKTLVFGNTELVLDKTDADGNSLCPDCLARWNSIENLAKSFQGEALYNQLNAVVDMDQMMEWLAVNRVLRNGDFGDEFVMYATKKDEPLRLQGWDMDDLFKEKMHFFSRLLIQGKKFLRFTTLGLTSTIPTDDLIFNYEAPIFRVIPSDPYVLNRYYDAVARVVFKMTKKDTARRVIEEIGRDIAPFFDEPSILGMSAIDDEEITGGTPYTPAAITTKLAQRRDQIQTELNLLAKIPHIAQRLVDLAANGDKAACAQKSKGK